MKRIRWNRYTWYSRLAAIFLFLGIVPVIAFFIGVRYQETCELILKDIPRAMISGAPAPDMTDWKTLTNKLYAFTLRYPTTAAPTTELATFYHLGNGWQVNAPADSKGKVILAIPIFRTESETSYPRYYDAEVRVGASVDKQNIAHCTGPNPGEIASTQSIDFGGATWSVYPLESAGMMQYLRGVSYRTVRDNTCFALEVIQAGSTYRDDSMGAGLSERTLAKYADEAARVASTFSFTN